VSVVFFTVPVTLRVPRLDRSASRVVSVPGFCCAAAGIAEHVRDRARATAAARRMA